MKSPATTSRHFAPLSLALALALLTTSQAANLTWSDSAGNTVWTSNASWSGGIAPDNTSSVNDNAIFTSVLNAQPEITVLTRINGVDFQMPAGSLNLTGAGNFLIGANGIDATGQISGTNTVAVNNIQLNSASTWNIFSSTNTAGTSTFTVNSTVNLNGNNLTINGKRNTTSGNVGVINFNGVISGNASILVHPDNFRTTTAFNALNTYNGTTSVRGTLNANSLANAGTASALGSSGDIVIGNNVSSAGLVFINVTANSTTDRNIQFQGTSSGGVFQIANNSANGTVSFTNPGTIGAAASAATQDLNVRFAGTNTGLNTFGQVINNRTNTTGITNVQKQDAGTWALTGNNTYTGTTSISLGILQVGAGSDTGSIETTSAIINTGSLVYSVGNGTRTMNAVISGNGTLTQNSANGTLTLTGNNSYTGGTTVSAGTVTVQNDQSSATGGWSIGPNNSAAVTGNFSAGSTVAVASGKKIQIGNSGSSGSSNSLLTVAGTVNNSGTLQVGRSASLILNNGTIWNQSGSVSLTSLGGTSATLTINSGASVIYSGSNTVKLNLNNSSNANAILAIDGTGICTTGAGFENAATGITTTPTGNSRVTLTNGGTLKLSANVADLTTQTQFTLGTGGGVIDNNGFNTALSGVVTAGTTKTATGITGNGSLTSQGNGTLTLSGVNTYTGNTTVNGGTLAVSSAGFDDASTVSVSSGAILTLNFVGTDTIAALFINGVQKSVGLYDFSNSSGAINGTGSLTVTTGPVVTDTTPPVITPAAPAAINWGSSYTDTPPTATDETAPANPTVNFSGTVNTAKPGVYTITYNATDAAGNAATPVTRTVTVSIASPTTVGADGFSPLLRYALGANSPTDTVQAPVLNSTATTLSLTAVVRIDNTALTIGAEAVDSLTGTWGTGGTITVTDSPDQSGTSIGITTRKIFTVDTTGATRKFLRLTATLTP